MASTPGPVVLFGALALGLLGACGGGDDDDGDAGVDAGLDGGGRDAGVDGGVECAPACLAPDRCCPAGEGSEVGVCVDTRNDTAHCGGCNRVCGGLFTGCAGGRCICGETPCFAPNECCPGPDEGDPPRCRSLDTPSDCGECGNACDRELAPTCTVAGCVCGGEGRACDAEVGETCCFDTLPPLPTTPRVCVELGNDPRHCGRCGRRCPLGARCEDGVCAFGDTPCTATCLPEQVCCDGQCCLDLQCDGSTCDFSRAP